MVMKQVYIAPDIVGAQMMKDYLVSFGIESFVQGDLLIGAIGEIPTNSYPTVWVLNDADIERAEERVRNFESQQQDDQVYSNVWKCIACDELIEAQFTHCWNCGRERKT
jgi:hypothetical protein